MGPDDTGRNASGRVGMVSQVGPHTKANYHWPFPYLCKTVQIFLIPYMDFRSRETRNFSFIYERTRISVDHVLVEQGGGDRTAPLAK